MAVSTPWVEQLNPVRGHTIAGALDLVERAALEDGSRAISEQALLTLRRDSSGASTYAIVGEDNAFIGFALVSGGSCELVVDPRRRRLGYGTALVDRVLSDSSQSLNLWAHGSHPGALAIAASHHLIATRRLWQMYAPLDQALPELSLPDGVSVRPFEVGIDEQAWLALNAAAFAAHPEQGAWSEADLLAREREPWFDPAGFLLAEREGGRVVGFHWTKVHLAGELGEVYVVGVHPSEQGTGLGSRLTLAGLRYLKEHGIRTVMLYVDETNLAAIRVYERLGFIHEYTDICFTR